jgi:hypothetical protein
MDVRRNELASLPHREGQEVLRVRDGAYLLSCAFTGGRYWLHLFVVQDSLVAYTRMVRGAATVDEVRKVGRWMLKQSR